MVKKSGLMKVNPFFDCMQVYLLLRIFNIYELFFLKMRVEVSVHKAAVTSWKLVFCSIKKGGLLDLL